MSKYIARAVRDLALSPGWELTSIYEVGGQGQADEHWITQFANDGGEAILSADKDFLTLEPQVNAVFDTGMRVIHLPKRWGLAKGHLQAGFILQWWPRIEAQISNMRPRECYRPTWNISETGQMKKVTIDFAKAQKKRRRSRSRPGK